MAKPRKIEGQKFGRLTILQDVKDLTNRSDAEQKRNRFVLCRCDCGTQTSVRIDRLRSGKTRSCGCLHKELRWAQSWKSVTGDESAQQAILEQSTKLKAQAQEVVGPGEPEPKRHDAEKRHDLPPGTYDALLLAQQGVCGICGDPPGNKALQVDHEHSTGQVRGLLCGRCNTGLGFFRDNIMHLARAMKYLACERATIVRGPAAKER